MRKILFRGKVADEPDEWVYGYLRDEDTIFQQAIHEKSKCCGCGFFSVKPETIGQFTGLTDKKGTKIFEGDIVKGCSKSYKPNYICEVYFNENMCHFGLTINKGSYTKHQTHDWLELTNAKSKKLEVIGNIYDNSELLSGGKV